MDSIPSDLEKYRNKLDEELAILHYKWDTIQELYKNEERIEILNKTAANFFLLFKSMMIDDLQLSICKLSEKHEKSGNRNLSFEIIINSLGENHLQLKEELNDIFLCLRDETKDLRDARNKTISHIDLDVFNSGDVKDLKSFTSKEIEKALKLSRKFMDTFNNYFFERTTNYNRKLVIGNVDDLLDNLKRALHYEELVQRREIKPYLASDAKYKDV